MTYKCSLWPNFWPSPTDWKERKTVYLVFIYLDMRKMLTLSFFSYGCTLWLFLLQLKKKRNMFIDRWCCILFRLATGLLLESFISISWAIYEKNIYFTMDKYSTEKMSAMKTTKMRILVQRTYTIMTMIHLSNGCMAKWLERSLSTSLSVNMSSLSPLSSFCTLDISAVSF